MRAASLTGSEQRRLERPLEALARTPPRVERTGEVSGVLTDHETQREQDSFLSLQSGVHRSSVLIKVF